jgi:hypothetical protein
MDNGKHFVNIGYRLDGARVSYLATGSANSAGLAMLSGQPCLTLWWGV